MEEKMMKKLKNILFMLLCITVLTACSKVTPDQALEGASTQETAVTPEAQETEVEEADDEQEAIAVEVITEETATQEDTQAADKIEIKIAALKGPTAIGMVKVMEDTAAGTTENNYTFTIAGAADEISTGLVKGEFDIAAVPCNLASVLYNKTEGKIKMAAINTLGVLYIVETGDTIKTVEDLKGKTIYSTGFGTTPQFTLNYLLNSYGIDPEKDVTIVYKTEATEVAAILAETTDAVAMLPQPYVTTVMMNNDKLRIALNVAEEWDAVSTDGSSVVTGVVVVRSEWLENNKEAFDAFLAEYAASTTYVNEQIDEASALVEKFDIFKAAPMKKAIPYCNITLIQGFEMKEKVNGYLNVLFGQNPQSVGGKLPADDFYYQP
jgi:NitT/TauT family transport system substrate-binding protein